MDFWSIAWFVAMIVIMVAGAMIATFAMMREEKKYGMTLDIRRNVRLRSAVTVCWIICLINVIALVLVGWILWVRL